MPKPTAWDVILWLLLSAMWSSSYAVIKVGVSSMEPAILVLGRLLIGSIVIYLVLHFRGHRLSTRAQDWLDYAVTGILGSALPFLLITLGERSVDSALAAILMGAVPLITLCLAASILPSETLSFRQISGMLGAFTGIILLVGPAAIISLGAQLWGQAAILCATGCYAASTVYIRRYVKRPPLEMAAGSMICGTICIAIYVPFSEGDLNAIALDHTALAAIIYLGLFSTASANLIYFYLVPRLGPTRVAQVNFAVPVGGALIGHALLNEALTLERILALLLISVSVYLGTRTAKDRRADASKLTVQNPSAALKSRRA